MYLRVGVLAAFALILSACDDGASRPPSQFKSTDVTGVDWGRDFHLTDHNGNPKRLADFKGKVVMLFFGFTHCPDMCPMALSEMALAVKQLGKDGDRVQGLFITLDPGRDTREVLAQYVPAFNSSFLGLYADEAATAGTAKEFKVFYSPQTADAQGNYTVDHTAAIFVFDAHGRLRLFMGAGRTVEAMVHDIRLLLTG